MKRFAKSILGVTLLEIMLVLAIAAMIIVMSVRYYQSASSGQQANSVVAMLSTIVASADSLAQSTGSYSGTATNSAIASVIGTSGMNTPWGAGPVTVNPSPSNIEMTIPKMPTAVCNLVKAKLGSNSHYSGGTATGTAISCGGNAAGTNIYYIANPT